MSFPCKILASFLLIFNFPTKGSDCQDNIWGVLDQDINLEIPGFQKNHITDDIQWKKGSNTNKIAQYKRDKKYVQLNDTYEVFENGTLKIKRLTKNSEGCYKVVIYDINGKNLLEKSFNLKTLELVSKPNIFWDCVNRTLTCNITKGSHFELRLIKNEKNLTKSYQNTIKYKWSTNPGGVVKCTAQNNRSEESVTVPLVCPGKSLDMYLIISISVGGSLLIIFVALLIFYVSKRKKQNSRRNDEEVEIRVHRANTEERSQKPHQSVPHNPAATQPPPPLGHRSQTSGPRPLPPGHRVQHQPQRRPPPGTQVHQHKGPPLPRPRVQPKPPHGAAENSSSPSSN
ncbi:T-cell surface antigen CD2 [Nycticebus coucang]|uniref:T-cell surface antigen CD2 n=1 Tax=Nycticebus coucang TaxID=9470 RepID=UPI00234DF165|nr:T-cell surface antigen CD2 [Nycticebus coucang]